MTARRLRTAGTVETAVAGHLYLLHLSRPLGDPTRPRCSALHYLGWCHVGTLERRLQQHAEGRGAAMLRAAVAAGIDWQLVATWEGTRHRERSMKRRGPARYCPLCAPATRLRAAA